MRLTRRAQRAARTVAPRQVVAQELVDATFVEPPRASVRPASGCVGRRFGERYRQPGNLNDAIRVLQLNEPLAFKYSLVYQKVQSSTGSTVIAL